VADAGVAGVAGVAGLVCRIALRLLFAFCFLFFVFCFLLFASMQYAPL
jgi:hypothetical protein